MEIREELFKLKDEKYRLFHSKLVPTVDAERIIGVRMPLLRKLAKEFSGTAEKDCFLYELPHFYYEENNIHMLLIGEIKAFDEAICETERFLPYIDNWATCDIPIPKVFGENREKLLPFAECWMKSAHTYTVRYGIKALMDLFLDESFDEEYFELICHVKAEDYYVKMMAAWYFATALAKQYDSAIKVLEQNKLSPWIHNKTIQKAVESRVIDKKTKEYLRTLRLA